MITHDEALLNVQQGVQEHHVRRFLVEYISQQHHLEIEHEALKRDVARYFELAPKFKSITKEKQIECYQLQEKLSKVGNEK